MKPISQLEERIQRLLNKTATEDDLRILRDARIEGNLVVVTGEGAVALGGQVTDSIIVTGDNNTIIKLQATDVSTQLVTRCLSAIFSFSAQTMANATNVASTLLSKPAGVTA